jgi:hypothetical protein
MLNSGTHGTEDVQARMQKMIYTVWNLWKERCRQVFDNKAVPPNVLTNGIKLDVQQLCAAWNRGAGSIGASLYEAVM